MSDKRSELRVRARPHHRPDRAGETIVEVWRDGEQVATIYGTREGVQILSPYFERRNAPFYFESAETPSFVVPMLAPGEACPWCEGKQAIELGGKIFPCPVCNREWPFNEELKP